MEKDEYSLPKIQLHWLPVMIGYAAVGGLLAGAYGILHDEVTYSISPEYFTRMKFLQFHHANFGLPPRVFVAEIGFLASWWVGFFAAWFVARITVPAFPPAERGRYTIRGFSIIFAFAVFSSIIGYLFGSMHGSDYSAWQDLTTRLGIIDVGDFVHVAYIHNASYLGGLIGLIVAIFYLHKHKMLNKARAAN